MPAERDLVSGVVQLANLLLRRLAPVFEKAKVTPQQWLVLSAIAAEESPVTLVALSRRLAVTKQNMTGMIARLEQLGVAERHGDPTDLRSSRVGLSRRGRAVMEKTRPAYEEWVRTLATGDVTERDLQTVVRVIEKLITQMES